MTERRRQENPAEDLANWERWPLAALFLANALNVFLLYVPEADMPPLVANLLPWVRVFCGIAAAASLEGTLIAVTMGRRLGRDSKWSWATMFAAAAFTAAVAWYVHAEVGRVAAGLFMAQAVVLFIYSQHLAQPRKDLQDEKKTQNHSGARSEPREAAIVVAKSKSRDDVTASVKLLTCRACGLHGFHTLADVNRHRREECQGG
jgi:hypothetical protein